MLKFITHKTKCSGLNNLFAAHIKIVVHPFFARTIIFHGRFSDCMSSFELITTKFRNKIEKRHSLLINKLYHLRTYLEKCQEYWISLDLYVNKGNNLKKRDNNNTQPSGALKNHLKILYCRNVQYSRAAALCVQRLSFNSIHSRDSLPPCQ